jgi:uncharacterized membrane protein YphA (DoxX/SURF4 family)
MLKIRLLEQPAVGLFWLALLRVMIALMFLTTWGNNLVQGRYTPEGLFVFFTQTFPQSANPLGWYAGFINAVILPNRAMFAPFQLVAEALMGLALLAGVFTPPVSAIAAFFLANIFLATFGHDWPWAYLMPISLLGLFCLTRAGRSLGVDAWLFKRFGEPPARLPLW